MSEEWHSDIMGGSSAKRRIECLGSRDYEAQIPAPASSIYASEGTDLHNMMEYRLAYGKFSQLDWLKCTDEQRDVLLWCLGKWEEMRDGHLLNILSLEERMMFPGIDGAGGTADILAQSGDKSVLHIFDYKFGMDRVSAEDNYQLLFYMACARALHGPHMAYHVHILQPRLDNHSSWRFYDWQLDDFIKLAMDAHEATDRPFSAGEWCKFCKGNVTCPAKVDMLKKRTLWEELTQENVPHALSILEEVETWAKDLRAMAEDIMMDKQISIQGWKVVKTKPRRKWLDSDTAMRMLQELGLDEDTVAPRKLVTPAQADTLLRRNRLDEYDDETWTELVSSGQKVVPESFPAQAINTKPVEGSALSEAVKTARKEKK